ncbi:MAG: hypothetical protein M0R33_20995 [Methylomonas sp.]|jgi:hypothetical protein|uniref:hypothetical protein n=1 Tax=Methylomonas sp. TaxID=418 RepID=UPI0025D5318F|nr:hypothetical protein [Methylomonas sp.]MCK9608926.1 hypothetical protein [Methylomonas sp.]
MRLLLWTGKLLLLIFLSQTARAASLLNLEVGSHGMATVVVTIDAITQTSPKSTSVNVVALPFKLDQTYRFSRPDDVEVSLLYNADGFALITIMGSTKPQQTTIKIENAFNLIDERVQGRVKFEFDFSFPNLQKYRDVLSLPITISKFDVTIKLPRDYQFDQLSFFPPSDKWVEQKRGKEYLLKSDQSELSKTPIFIAFPSPFESGLHFAELVTGIVIGLFMLGWEGNFAKKRSLDRKSAVVIMLLSFIVSGVAIYFCFTVGDPIEYMAWAVGPLIPIVTSPFICIWLLIAMNKEAEISGQITVAGERARYISVSVLKKTENQEILLKQTTVDLDGTYRFFIWCDETDMSVFVRAWGAGVESRESQIYILQAGHKQQVPAIDVKRIQITGATSPTS